MSGPRNAHVDVVPAGGRLAAHLNDAGRALRVEAKPLGGRERVDRQVAAPLAQRAHHGLLAQLLAEDVGAQMAERALVAHQLERHPAGDPLPDLVGVDPPDGRHAPRRAHPVPGRQVLGRRVVHDALRSSSRSARSSARWTAAPRCRSPSSRARCRRRTRGRRTACPGGGSAATRARTDGRQTRTPPAARTSSQISAVDFPRQSITSSSPNAR